MVSMVFGNNAEYLHYTVEQRISRQLRKKQNVVFTVCSKMYIIRKPMRQERLTYVSLVILSTHVVGSLLCLSFLVDC
jgi:nitroimidazol reductase NimA-like FMN-containing flavoprotein (pyridoxamine 5'-phosphate oxidase superfamily)